ncbi:MAG: BPL-N domain-containing protein [Candidatus Thorarchaeota archaeon]
MVHWQKHLGLFTCMLVVLPVPLDVMFWHSTSVVMQSETDLEGVRVAIYRIDRLDNFSFTACLNLFHWMNATVELLDGTAIQQGGLFGFDLLVFPSYGPSSYERELTALGKGRIRQFIASGGSFFSVCRGTEFAVRSLQLVTAELKLIGAYGVQCMDSHPGPLYLAEMTVNHSSPGPDLSDEPDSYSLFCSGAAYFDVADTSGVNPILSYANTGYPGMITFHYGHGTVFLSSPHPEYEEGSDRDGMTQTDLIHIPPYKKLNDSDSEWDLLCKISRWLVNTSPDIPEPQISTLIMIGVLSLVVIIGGVIVIRRR